MVEVTDHSKGETIRRNELAGQVIKYRLRKLAEEWELLASLYSRNANLFTEEHHETIARIHDEMGEIKGDNNG